MEVRLRGLQLCRPDPVAKEASRTGYVYPKMEFRSFFGAHDPLLRDGVEQPYSLYLAGVQAEFAVTMDMKSGRVDTKVTSLTLSPQLKEEGWSYYGPELEVRYTPQIQREFSVRVGGQRPGKVGRYIEPVVAQYVRMPDTWEGVKADYSLDKILKEDMPKGKVMATEYAHPQPVKSSGALFDLISGTLPKHPPELDYFGLPIRSDIHVDWEKQMLESGARIRGGMNRNPMAGVGLESLERIDPLNPGLLEALFYDWGTALGKAPNRGRALMPHEMGQELTLMPMTDPHLGHNPDQNLDVILAELEALNTSIENGALEFVYPNAADKLDLSKYLTSEYLHTGIMFEGMSEHARRAFIDSVTPRTHGDFIGDSLLHRKEAKRRGGMALSLGSMFPRNPNPAVLDEHGNGKKRHEPFKRDRFGKHGGPKGRKGRSKK